MLSQGDISEDKSQNKNSAIDSANASTLIHESLNSKIREKEKKEWAFDQTEE